MPNEEDEVGSFESDVVSLNNKTQMIKITRIIIPVDDDDDVRMRGTGTERWKKMKKMYACLS